MEKIKEDFTAPNGNKIEVRQFDHLGSDYIVIIDRSCQIDKAYKIGSKEVLNFYTNESVIIKDFNQVIEAWKTDKVWF